MMAMENDSDFLRSFMKRWKSQKVF